VLNWNFTDVPPHLMKMGLSSETETYRRMKLWLVMEPGNSPEEDEIPVGACTSDELAEKLIEKLCAESGLPDWYYTIHIVPLYSDITIIDEDLDAA